MDKLNEKNLVLGFDDSESLLSEYQSVDEGAINVLSMDEIRNMRNLEINFQINQEKIKDQLA